MLIALSATEPSPWLPLPRTQQKPRWAETADRGLSLFTPFAIRQYCEQNLEMSSSYLSEEPAPKHSGRSHESGAEQE